MSFAVALRGREGSVFPKPIGTPKQINQQGQEILENILNHPNKKINIGILSSKRTSTWKSIKDFISDISMKLYNTSKYSFESLPHILIMCCHPQRIRNDCQLLLDDIPMK